jgi:hypothetical protein
MDFAAKPKLAGTALKGLCCNDEDPAAVNPLNPEWMYIEFGSWCWNLNAQYVCKWALHLFDAVPLPEDVAKAIQHPSYEGWWLTLNEPDLAGVSPASAVELIQAQIQVVRSVDPGARFCLGVGSQLHAVGTADPWFPAVWKLLPANLKPAVRAFHTHYYAQSQQGLSHEQFYSPEPVRKYVNTWRKWMNKNAKEFRRELWMTEIGMVNTPQVLADSRGTLYPLVVQDAMNGVAERWAWYSMSTNDGYATLCEPYAPTQTALGRVFSAIKPGVYPVRLAS